MLDRLGNDFQLSIITLLGGCAVFGILPFALYRFAEGSWLVGLIDLVIALCIAGAVLYAWQSGDTDSAGMFLVASNSLGGVLVAQMLGTIGLFWLYAVFLANYFLTGPRRATAAVGLAMLVLVWLGEAFTGHAEMVSFVVTGVIVSVFAFIFAYRAESQRQQLEVVAGCDPLTGIGNRRSMERELDLAVATQARSGQTYGLLLLDLDHFKRVNDTYGHGVGDRVLAEFAQVVVSSIRRADSVFRFGGEEFVVLLPGADQAGVLIVAQAVRRAVTGRLSLPEGTVTVSAGIAVLQPQESRQSWLERADRALYEAKQQGRDCLVLAPAGPPIV